MMTMLIGTVEHIVFAYDDDMGYGATLCEEKIGRCDLGPRMDEPITCPKCNEIQIKNSKIPTCNIREHVGIERVIQKLGMDQTIMPDPELGQDVAFLAHVITVDKALLGRYRGALEQVHMWGAHDLGSLTGKMCKLTCPVCIARKALGLPEPGTGTPA